MSFVIQSGSKQYMVNPGQTIAVDRLKNVEEGDFVDLPVLFSIKGDFPKTIKAKVLSHTKGSKIRVVKYRAKSNYHRQYGYRHFITVLMIEEV